MQTFDVSANILNDKLSFSAAGKGAAASKAAAAKAALRPVKPVPVDASPPPEESGLARCDANLGRFQILIGVVVLQLIVLILVCLQELPTPPAFLLFIVLLATPGVPFAMLWVGRSGTVPRHLWLVLLLHDFAVVAVRHV